MSLNRKALIGNHDFLVFLLFCSDTLAISSVLWKLEEIVKRLTFSNFIFAHLVSHRSQNLWVLLDIADFCNFLVWKIKNISVSLKCI